MTSIEDIAHQAEAAWQLGMQDEQAGRMEAAHAHFRRAHDLVVDCPRLHHTAHVHLRRLNIKRRAYRDLLTDVLLLGLAPLAIFEIVAFLMKRQVLGGTICAR
ncbi:hypothetical protein [Aquabacterium sp. CECT 9606]|uniref:hypothetical protein n=1 Tax=Aquabacterium sp. CECT 9606 TaxID=2845822 RepID=UPI001E310503|nr:hypothetical protein [Aquabacterium sp. CECT 9606]CAH0355568.1 hypothetical protein AQB9606_04279 [Aquabacterium sp. CECT 9606]